MDEGPRLPTPPMQTLYGCTCTKDRGFNDPREMIFNIVPAQRAEVDLKKSAEFAEQTSTTTPPATKAEIDGHSIL